MNLPRGEGGGRDGEIRENGQIFWSAGESPSDKSLSREKGVGLRTVDGKKNE